MSPLLLITMAAVCNTLALTMLKLAGDQLRAGNGYLAVLEKSWLLLLIGLILYGTSFLLAIKIFSVSTFSRAVPVFVGLNVLSSLAIASLYFRETLSLGILSGSVFIIAGIWLIQANSL